MQPPTLADPVASAGSDALGGPDVLNGEQQRLSILPPRAAAAALTRQLRRAFPVPAASHHHPAMPLLHRGSPRPAQKGALCSRTARPNRVLSLPACADWPIAHTRTVPQVNSAHAALEHSSANSDAVIAGGAPNMDCAESWPLLGGVRAPRTSAPNISAGGLRQRTVFWGLLPF